MNDNNNDDPLRPEDRARQLYRFSFGLQLVVAASLLGLIIGLALLLT